MTESDGLTAAIGVVAGIVLVRLFDLAGHGIEIVGGVIVLATLLFLTPLFDDLPEPVLAAIVRFEAPLVYANADRLATASRELLKSSSGLGTAGGRRLIKR